MISIFQLPSYYEREDNDHDFNFFRFDIESILISFGLLISAYNMLPNFIGIAESMENPNKRRLNKIFKRSYILLIVFYFSIALVGYLSLGSNKNEEKDPRRDLFIFREPLKDTSDWLMIIARSFLLVGLLLAAGFILFPIKSMICGDLSKIDNKKNILVSAGIVILPLIIGTQFYNISNYMTIGGALGGSFLGYFYPGLVGLKSNYLI